jgi:preprotein translocase subunit SecF
MHEVYVRVPLRPGFQGPRISRLASSRRCARPRGRNPIKEVRSQSYIGPTVGRELVKKALGAVIGSMAGMLVYIWIRFEFQWGLAGVIALVHDTIITLGLFSLFGYEMSLPVVAAFLTLVGYSMNDTVVIFDRIRENLRAKGGTVSSLPDLIKHVDEPDAVANDPDVAAHLDHVRVPVRGSAVPRCATSRS